MSRNGREDGGAAFPCPTGSDGGIFQGGMSLRDYFAAHAPEPDNSRVETAMKLEQYANPHNDSYKPRRRGETEIRCALRYEWADAMLKERDK